MVPKRIKRRYNLCYKARKNGYVVLTRERMMELPSDNSRDTRIEKDLSEFGFYVQLKIL